MRKYLKWLINLVTVSVLTLSTTNIAEGRFKLSEWFIHGNRILSELIAAGDALLLETGDYLLLENGDKLLLETVPDSGTVLTADSCSQADVQTTLNLVSEDGDVVRLPTCAATPTEWSTGVSLNTSIEFTIEGTSEAATQIKYTGTGTVFDFSSAPSDDNGFRGLSNITVTGNTTSGTHSGANNSSTYIDTLGRNLSTLGMGTGSFAYNETDGCLAAVAIGGFSTTVSTNDTLTFSVISGGTDGDFDTGDTVTLYLSRNGSQTLLRAYTESNHPELYIHDITVGAFHTIGRLIGYHGVISDSTFNRPAWASAYGWYLEGSYIDGWPMANPTLGTREAIFVEDNIFQGYCHAVSGFCGVHYVYRYNTRNEDARAGSGCGIDTHEGGYNECRPLGTPALYHGGRAWEVYNNTFNSGDVDQHDGLYMRSGIGVATNNTFTDHHIGVALVVDGNSRGPDCNITEDCPLDDYDKTTDCSAAGEGCCETLTDVWVWGNTYNDVAIETQLNSYNSCLALDAANGPAMYDEAPYIGRDGFEWTAFTYPHPLRN